MPIIGRSEATMQWDSIDAAAAAIDWRFLTPWRDLLRRLLEYKDCDEFEVGTLQDRLDYLLVHLEGLNHHDGEARTAFVVLVREALELIGLALHYDPLAWSGFLHPVMWDRDPESIADPFAYDVTQLQPLFQLQLEHDDIENDSSDFDLLCELLVEIDGETMSEAYADAKMQLKREVTAAGLFFDEDYRVPLKLDIAPGWDGVGTEPEWCVPLRKLVWSLNDRSSCGGSAFQLVSMDMRCWHCGAHSTTWIKTVLAESRLANVVVAGLSLPPPPIDVATLNMLTGIGNQSQEGPFVDSLYVIRNKGTTAEPGMDIFHWIKVCSSVVHAHGLKSLHLFRCLPKRDDERAVCWRWLGFALQCQFSLSSVRELQLKEHKLTLSDLEMFKGESNQAFMTGMSSVENQAYLDPYPDSFEEGAVVRSVQLDPDTVVTRFGFGEATVEDLLLPSDTDFIVMNENVEGCEEPSMMVLVPGFGLCSVPCESVVNASEFHVGDKLKTKIERLRLDIDKSESMALSGFVSRFGSSLLRLELVMSRKATLSHDELTALLIGCPQLQYLELNTLNLESMDAFTTAYQEHGCQISVLTMWNVYVESASMTRFAHELSISTSPLSSQLREFRFICEDIEKSSGECPQIITDHGARFFYDATRLSSSLSFFEIGLVRCVYDQWAPRFSLEDRKHVSSRWKGTKWAFLSVAVVREPVAKKQKTRTGIRLPVKHRRKLVTRILEFLRPPANRVVNVICVPRLD